MNKAESKEAVKNIVDYYMRFVTHERRPIREMLEYAWGAMNNYTLEDRLEEIEQKKPIRLSDAQIEQIFKRHYGAESKFDAMKLEFIQDVLRSAQYK